MSLKADVQDLAHELATMAVRASEIAALIPTPTDAKIEEAHASRKKTGRRDRNGKKLRVGDLVEVTASERYGTVKAVVLGASPTVGDEKERVHVSLLDGRNDDYRPSTGRVTRLGRPVSGGTMLVFDSARLDLPNGGDGDPDAVRREVEFSVRRG